MNILRLLGSLVGASALLFGCGPATAPPQAVLYPDLTGPYAVGRTSQHFSDRSRKEGYTDDPDDTRELMAYLWYPASPAPQAQPGPWVDEALARALAETLDSPVEHLTHVKTHAYPGAPLSEARARYPVPVMSHGDGTHPALYTSVAEELASHGYVVVGLAHTYNAATTVFPDGRTLFAKEDALAAYTGLSSDAPFWDATQALWRQGTETLAVWADDVGFVVEQLEAMNATDPVFADHLELSKLGIFGHSFGGATATELLHRDGRFRAGANLDGSVFGLYAEDIPRPWPNLVTGDEPAQTLSNDELEQLGLTRDQFETVVSQLQARRRTFEASPEAYNLTLERTGHGNYSDTGLLAPLFPTLQEDLGPIGAERALRIVDDYLLAFFDTFLEGKASPLLDGSSPYPEVKLEARRP